MVPTFLPFIVGEAYSILTQKKFVYVHFTILRFLLPIIVVPLYTLAKPL